jgi:hypothetical protein
MTHKSTYKRAEKVVKEIEERFEPGRQDRSVANICRNFLNKETGLSERTYYRYRKLIYGTPKPKPEIDYRNSLFPELAEEE